MSIKKNFFAPWAKGLGATRRAAVLLLVMMLTATTAWADDSGNCGTYVTYSYFELSHTLTIRGTGAMYDYYNLSGRPWNSYADEIRTVVIENGVTSIGAYAFAECQGLTSIEIPASVTSIGKCAFIGCQYLTSITFAKGSQLESIGESAFSSSLLTSIEIPAGVTSIGESAFSECTNLGSVTFAEGSRLKSIGDNAFRLCSNLTSITIPASVTSIGSYVFQNCDLASMAVEDGNKVYDSRNGCNAIIETSSNKLIAGCKNSTIPASVTSIGNYAFSETLLTSIEIPAGVTSIGERAFQSCFYLATVTVYAPPCSLGDNAFANCNNLANIYVFSDLVDDYQEARNWSAYAGKITAIEGIALADNADNSSLITAANGSFLNVTLQGRTLYKDGAWNTLCLPFNVTLAGSPLEGATVMKLIPETSNLTDGTLTLNFEDETTTMTAGKPYIIKWDGTYIGDPIVNPVFSGVTINNSASTEVSFTGGSFKGTYKPIVWNEENKSILFLGDNNTLYWPKPDGDNMPHLNAFRAYFELSDPNGVREFNLNFDGEETTSITTTDSWTSQAAKPSNTDKADKWYDMQGRKVSKPTKKGMYIHKGSKVVIK